MRRGLRRSLPVVGLLLAGAWFVLGVNWGLPSRRADAYLFGDPLKAWSGERILQLAGGWAEDAGRGADVDLNPVTGRQEPVVLNATDEQRAEIVRRYRLFSHQPDEMITFRALSQMRPGEGKLDPRLYQYGGLWIYPVGILLKLGSLVGLVDLKSDLAYYLDHPEAFGRFYVVARLYSAAWGVVGVLAVYQTVRRIVGASDLGAVAPFVAAACFAAMPVVVNMAHEAKPHLPGAVLMLLAVLAAANYVQTGRRRWWVAAGALCGAAFGMVLSALPVFVVLPLMTLLRRQTTWRQRVVVTVAAALIGVDVYFVTNPYVLIHLVGRGEALRSNLANSTAMYSAGGSAGALLNAAVLLAEGTGTALALLGAAGAVGLGGRALRVRKDQSPEEVARRAGGLLLAAPALLVLGQFVALAANKPGEYGRFALLPAVFLMVEAVAAVATVADWFPPPPFRRRRVGAIALGFLFVLALLSGLPYTARFVDDASGATTRLRAAEVLAGMPAEVPTAVEAEPAPYSMPPVNLFTRRIILLPRAARPEAAGAPGAPGTAAVLVRPVDRPNRFAVPEPQGLELRTAAPITWAAKRFEVRPVEVPVGPGVGE